MKNDYIMTFILPELSLLFVQKINIMITINTKVYKINVEKNTALEEPTAKRFLVLIKKKSTFINYMY